MEFEHIALTIKDNIAFIEIQRRAMHTPFAKELMEAALICDNDDRIRAVLISSTDTMFSAGGDLAFFASEGDQVSKALKEMTIYYHSALSLLNSMAKPVIAAVNGAAAGAGFSLTMACDLVIASSRSAFVMAYTAAGLSPDGSSSYFLPRLVGERRAKELMMCNRKLSAQEALEWGLVNQVCENGKELDVATALAHTLAQGPTQSFASVKQLINASSHQNLDTQMKMEADHIAANATGTDGQEGIAAFLEKRPAQFIGKQ